MVTSFALSLDLAANSLPRQVKLQLFVGTNVTLGSQVMQAFVVGMRSAFLISIALCLLAAGFSLVRGREDRRGPGQTRPAEPAEAQSARAQKDGHRAA